MSKIEAAFRNLIDAIGEEATEHVEKIKTAFEPLVTQVVAQATAAAVAGRFKFEDFLKDVTDEAEAPVADPLPTPAQNDAIKVLRTMGKTDEEIAEFVGVSILTVKMAV